MYLNGKCKWMWFFTIYLSQRNKIPRDAHKLDAFLLLFFIITALRSDYHKSNQSMRIENLFSER